MKKANIIFITASILLFTSNCRAESNEGMYTTLGIVSAIVAAGCGYVSISDYFAEPMRGEPGKPTAGMVAAAVISIWAFDKAAKEREKDNDRNKRSEVDNIITFNINRSNIKSCYNTQYGTSNKNILWINSFK